MRIAIVGATGMVGQSFLKIIEEYAIAYDELVLFASEKSAGKRMTVKGETHIVQALNEHSFDSGFDFALFSAGGELSKKYAPLAAQSGCVVIDNSSAWRMDSSVPLVVPEVNHEAAHKHHGIIANPNCSTIQSVLVLNALKSFGLKRVIYSTYQAVSGSGYKGIKDLQDNLEGKASTFYPKQILHNVIAQIDVFLEDGNTKEEQKMIEESRKILDLPQLPISATCVRVPVFNGHSIAVNVEFEKAFKLEAVIEALKKQAGLKVLEGHEYPSPLEVSGQDLTYVGRIRRDPSVANGLNLWVVADNIRKGAATNAIQILKSLVD